MNAVRPPNELGTILGVWAHPDDEAYLSGGLMATATDEGRRVVCVTATRGEAGFPADDPRTIEERTAIRESELAACLAVLGVTDHRWLDCRDGACDRVPPADIVATLCEIYDEVQPDTVLTFGPDGMTGHVDHIAVSQWATLAHRKMGGSTAQLLYATKTPAWSEEFMNLLDPDDVMMVEGLQPPTTPPDELALWKRLDDPMLDRKVRALRCQVSQIDAFEQEMGEGAFRELNRDEFFRFVAVDDWSN